MLGFAPTKSLVPSKQLVPLSTQQVEPLSVTTQLSFQSTTEQSLLFPGSVRSFLFKFQGPIHAIVSWIQSSGGLLAWLGFAPAMSLQSFDPLLQLTMQRPEPVSVATWLSSSFPSTAEQSLPFPGSESSSLFKFRGPIHAIISWVQSSGGVLALLGFARTKSLLTSNQLVPLTVQRGEPLLHPAQSALVSSTALAVLHTGTCPYFLAPKPNLTILDLVWLLACGLFSLSLVLHWDQSQRYIVDDDNNNNNNFDNFDNYDGSDDSNGLAMIAQPPTASTNTGGTRRRLHRRTLPTAPLRRSPRLLAQQNAVPRRSARIAAQARKRATTARG